MGTTPYGYQALSAKINVTSAGTNELVAAVSGNIIRVISLFLWVDNTNTIKFQSGSTDITGPAQTTSGDRVILPKNEYGWFWTSSGEALNLNTSKGHGVNGSLTYFLES